MNIPMTQAVGTSHAQPRMDCENSHQVLRSILSGVAVTQDQIDAYDLPTRPTKETDSRSRNFHGESVEVDALPPSVLREIARDCITQHVDDDAMERTRQVEEAEQETLTRIAEHAPDLNHLFGPRGTA
jgi:hypothetical protein